MATATSSGRSSWNGRVLQVEPMKHMLNAPGTKRLKLTYDKLLSTFAFNSNLRRYRMVRRPRAAQHGEAVHVEPINPVLKAPGTKRLKLEHDELLSSVAFSFNLRCYRMEKMRKILVGRCRLIL